MSRLPRITDDQTVRLRDMERRLAELEARSHSGVVIADVTLPGNAGPYTTTTTTSLVLANVPVDDHWKYKVCINAQGLLTVAGDGLWTVEFAVDGVNTRRLGLIQVGLNFRQWIGGSALWFPATGTPDLAIVVTEVSGGASLTLEGVEDVRPVQFWVEQVGHR